MSEDDLTSAEIADVNESWREIKEGKAKKFGTVDELLKELKAKPKKRRGTIILHNNPLSISSFLEEFGDENYEL